MRQAFTLIMPESKRVLLTIPRTVVLHWRTVWILAIQFMDLFSMAFRSSENPPLKPGIVRGKLFILEKVLKNRDS